MSETPTWADLFDRASEYGTTTTEIQRELDARREDDE